jgi:7-cyano-7-deazaguanine synthase
MYAQNQLNARQISYQIIEIKNLNVDSALTGTGEKGKYQNVSIYNVPGRNSIFLSLALSIAESKGIDTIWYGADFSDRLNLFPDCSQEYIYKINKLFEVAGSKPIKVEAPLLGMTKEFVMELLAYFNIKKEDLFSGYGNI